MTKGQNFRIEKENNSVLLSVTPCRQICGSRLCFWHFGLLHKGKTGSQIWSRVFSSFVKLSTFFSLSHKHSQINSQNFEKSCKDNELVNCSCICQTNWVLCIYLSLGNSNLIGVPSGPSISLMEENCWKPLPISLATKTSPSLHKLDASAKNSFILWTGDGQSLFLQSVQDITAP